MHLLSGETFDGCATNLPGSTGDDYGESLLHQYSVWMRQPCISGRKHAWSRFV